MITTVTLNASVDKAYHMAAPIQNGTVMRVAVCHNTAGGKGLNVARIVRLCGEKVQATGLVGGHNGAYLEQMLDADGIQHCFGRIAGETRSCINILDPEYGSTEYLEPGCNVTPEEEENFVRNVFPQVIRDSEVITLSGSVPKGMSADIYAKLIAAAKAQGKMVLLDTSGKLLKDSLSAQPTMVKPNKDEIEALFGVTVTGLEDVKQYAGKLYEMGIPYVVVSLGGDGALLICAEGIYQARPPKVQVVNTVGCGDSMVGAFAVALARKKTPQEALAYAAAVGTANALSASTGDFDPAVLPGLLEQMTVTKL